HCGPPFPSQRCFQPPDLVPIPKIGRVAGGSMEEIERVIRELESVREMLRNEGERVSREIAGYASLSHAATTAMKVIADSLKQWKDAPDKSSPGSASLY